MDELESTKIGASYQFSTTLLDNVVNYENITVILRTAYPNDGVVLATLAKNPTEGQLSIEIDEIDAKMFWCNIPPSITANALETAYEIALEATVPDPKFVGGKNVLKGSARLIRFER